MSFKISLSVVASTAAFCATGFGVLGTALAAGPAAGGSSSPAPNSASAPVSKGEAQALKWCRMLDRNGDGRLSRDETAWLVRYKPALAEEFHAADADGDGFVTQDEIRVLSKQRRAEREARRAAEKTPVKNGAAPASAK